MQFSSNRSQHSFNACIFPPFAGQRDGGGLYTQAAALEFGAMVFQNMFGALSFLKHRRDDDFVDRLSYFYTSSFLIMMAVLVSFKQVRWRLERA